MERAEFNKKVDAWVEALNKHKGEETVPWPAPYPIFEANFYGQQGLRWVTPDNIGHYLAAEGERNPLFWNEDYAKKTRWGGIMAPPTFTDAICISWITQREPSPIPWFFPTNPGGVTRRLLKPIRPGDKIRLVDKWLGLNEVVAREERPYRMFVDSVEKSYINQKDEVAAKVTSRFIRMAPYEDPAGRGSALFAAGGRKRHKFTDKELEAIYKLHAEDWRQGAEVLDWDKVNEGDEIRPLVTLPVTTLDATAFFAAQPGHAVAFDMRWERYIKQNPSGPGRDPETSAPVTGGELHLRDGTWGQGYILGYQMDGLLGRLICNWMGDDSWLQEMETRYRTLPILYDSYYMKGKVTKKYKEEGKNMVDLDIHIENQDGLVIVTGTAKVQLLGKA